MLHPLRAAAASIGFATLYVACVTGGGGYPGFGADATTGPSSSSSTSCTCMVENEGHSATLACGSSQCVGGTAFVCDAEGNLTQGLDCGGGMGGSTTGSGGMDGGGTGGSGGSTTTTSSSSDASACLSLGASCSLGDKCCSGALCESKCCIGPTQKGCAKDSDCCGGSCYGSPVPVCCSKSGQPCTTSSECCAGLGLTCSGGMCQQ